MMTKNVKHEWQVVTDAADWDALLPIEESVKHAVIEPQFRSTTRVWILFGSIGLMLVSVTIYILWLQAKHEIIPSQVDTEIATAQKRDAEPTVVEIESRQLLVTEHFRFRFLAADAPLVEDIGPRIDDFYRLLRRDFGLPFHPEPITVEIQQKSVVGSRLRLDKGLWRVSIPSPASLMLPASFSAADAIFLFLASALTEQTIEEIQQSTRVHRVWRQMPEVFRRWYVVRHHPALSGWHDDIVVWLATLEQPSNADSMPSSLRQTCRNFGQATLSIAWHSAIPVQSCMTATQGDKGLPILALPTDLKALNTTIYEWAESTYRIKWWVRLKAIETVIDYVVYEYGREQLGPLFQGFTQYDSWEELAPAVFNVSVEEFEAGWLAHLSKDELRQSSLRTIDDKNYWLKSQLQWRSINGLEH